MLGFRFVGGRVRRGRLEFACRDKHVWVAEGEERVAELRKVMAGEYHIYTVDDDFGGVSLECGDFKVEHSGPESVILNEEERERLRLGAEAETPDPPEPKQEA